MLGNANRLELTICGPLVVADSEKESLTTPDEPHGDLGEKRFGRKAIWAKSFIERENVDGDEADEE